MPARYALRRYSDLVAFWRDHQAMLRKGALFLPPGTLEEEPAPALKVDLFVPGPGRVGPIEAQVVNRMPDGGVALRFDELPPSVVAAVDMVGATMDGVREWLVSTGQLVPPPSFTEEEVAALKARVAELEERLATSEATRGELARLVASGAPPPTEGEADPSTSPRPAPRPAPVASSRGYVLPDLRGVAPKASGSLADKSLRQAFMAMAVERWTGILTMNLPDGTTRWGFWQKGGPVGWRTDPVQEDEVMGVLLYRAKQLTKDQLAESLAVMERRGVRQGEALIDMGLLTFAQVVLVLQKQNDFVLGRVLAARDGTWTFHEVAEHGERFLPPPARVAAALFRGLRQHTKEMPAEELASALRPHLDRYAYLVPGVERTLEEMRLSPDETQFIKIISKTSYRLREMSSVSNLSRSQTASMIWCLLDLGLIEFREEEASARVNARIARDLLSRKATMQKGTLFDRLELHWICTTPDVEAAWERLRAEFGPQAVGRYGDEWRPTMEFISEKMREAYERLRVDSSRREYRDEVMERMMIEQSAIMLGQKGEMAFMKENLREALDCYTKATELLPKNAEYQEGLKRARGGGAPAA